MVNYQDINIPDKENDCSYDDKRKSLIAELKNDEYVRGIEYYRDMDGNLRRIVIDFDY
jgi:hypothetical protein